MTDLARRVHRRIRRLIAMATARSRARATGVRLGPENLCLRPVGEWDVVVDVGVGHTPTFGPWVRELTGAFVVLCDPTPKHARRLREWVARTPRSALVECAVGIEDGPVDFFQSDAEESGSTLVSHVNRRGSGRSYSVPAITLKTLLDRAREHGSVALVKLDVEGVEFSILDGSSAASEAVESVGQWFIEFHPYPQTIHSFAELSKVKRWFHLKGYRAFTPNGIDYLFWR